MCLNPDKLLVNFFRPLPHIKTSTVCNTICFVKKLFTIILSIGLSQLVLAGSLNDFFKSTVHNGLIDYVLIKAEKQVELEAHIKSLDSAITTNPTIADYINIYNLFVIQQVVKHYPISSPNDVVGFFDQTKFNLNGTTITLNHLENKVIRPTYKDPRVHFALVCGAKGCPPIQSFAYANDSINKQLNAVTKAALTDQSFIQVQDDKSAKISQIFQWYNSDFGGSNKAIIKFINKFRGNNKIESISYYNYHWSLNDYKKTSSTTSNTSNVATYTPSVLLKKGQVEVQFFNNLYTQNAWFNDQGKRVKIGGRGSWNTLMMTFNYGVSKNSRFNLGLDVNLRSTRNDVEDSYAASIFKFEQNDKNRTTISALGPKIKWNPLKSVPKLSVQSALWIPVAKQLEGTPWLDWQRYTSWTQFFFDKPIGNKYQLFTELDLLFRVPELGSNLGLKQTIFSTPASVFFSYFPTSKSTIYAQIQYAPTLSDWPSYYTQAGLGGKYQLFPQLQVEASYTNFFAGHTQGAGATFNVGLRYISK